MKRRIAKPVVGAFLMDEPRAMIELNKSLETERVERILTSTYRTTDGLLITINELEQNPSIYSVSVDGRTPVILEAVEVWV